VFQEFDVVIATKDLPNTADIGSAKLISIGQRGTVLMAYPRSDEYPRGAYEVEFCNDLDTLAVMLVDGQNLDLVWSYSEAKLKATHTQQQKQPKPKTA
jgi:hypothetical protein